MAVAWTSILSGFTASLVSATVVTWNQDEQALGSMHQRQLWFDIDTNFKIDPLFRKAFRITQNYHIFADAYLEHEKIRGEMNHLCRKDLLP